jgi:fatty acid-binding protein DegV
MIFTPDYRGGVYPTTAAPSPEKFRSIYNSLANEGATEVLSIHVSSNLSSIMNLAQLAAERTKSLPVTVFITR